MAALRAAFHPWSMFNRHGWSKFGRRGQSFPFIRSVLRASKVFVLRGAKGSVSVSVHPARRSAAGIARDAGHHSRLCKLLYSSPALHALLAPRAVPEGTTHAETIDPGSKGCASHTSGFDPLTGDRAALHRSSRCSALQVRFNTAPLVSGSRPVAKIEGQALDPLITSLRHCARHRGLTRRHSVVERRHCQQAASNDARV